MPFKWEKLTVKSQQAVQAAASLAAENGNPEVLPMHLLAALLDDREGVVLPVLEGAGVRVQQLLAGANAAIAKLPKVSGSNAQPAMAASLQKVLDRASKEADSFNDDFISTEHLLLALLAGGAPLPGLQQPHVAYRMVDLHHTDAAGR